MQKFLFCIPLLSLALFIGCMEDPITGPEVKSRLIQRPPAVYLESLTGTTSLLARWNPSPSDTQANFKGYYVALYRSTFDSAAHRDNNLFPVIDTAHTGRGDTSHLFTGLTPFQRYSVYVWGERVPDSARPDSMILSKDSATASIDFDPTPVLAPTTLLANSAGTHVVNLRWSSSPSIAQKGFLGYVIRYRDSVNSKAKIYKQIYPSISAGTVVSIALPVESSASQIAKFLFWIKAVRNDSTESADSTFIAWSGAYRLPVSRAANISIDKKIFIGQVNTIYDCVESDKPEAQIGIDTSGGGLRFTALAGAKFAGTIDTGQLNTTLYKYPLDDAAYTQTAITLPLNSPSSGVIVYVLFAEGSRARVFILKDPVSGKLIAPNMKIGVAASFQPTNPFNLHYY